MDQDPQHNAPAGANPPRGPRSRAADMFSPHTYRELQVAVFAKLRLGEPIEIIDDASDDFDPLVSHDGADLTGVRSDAEHGSRGRSWGAYFSATAEHTGRTGEIATLAADRGDDGGADVETDEAAYRLSPGLESPFSDLSFAGGAFPGTPFQSEPISVGASDEATTSGAKPRRNMTAAALVGIPLLLGVIATAWWDPRAFAVVLYGFCIGGAIEWKRALRGYGRRIPLIPIIAATVGMAIATWFAKPEGLVVALLVGCAGVVAWRVVDERIENTLADSLAAMLTLLWIPFLASFLMLLEVAHDGWQRVVLVILAVTGNDSGGLWSGSLWGRHKMAPRVSPSKTWEGFAGGLFLGTAASTVGSYFLFDGNWLLGLVVGLTGTTAAVVGDLAESAIKRDINVKDMSGALPGHGGILDRLDSMVFAAPIAYVVFAVFLGTL